MTTKSRISKRWEPKRWRPEYTRIVGLSVLGKSNVWIAEKTGFTKEYVSQILNLPEGIKLANELATKLKEKMEVDIPSEMSVIAQQATRRLKTLMDDDELYKRSPFAVVGVGLDVLKGLKHLQGGGNGALNPSQGNTTIGTVIISNGQKSELMEGLTKIAEVRQLHSGSNGNGNGNKSP